MNHIINQKNIKRRTFKDDVLALVNGEYKNNFFQYFAVTEEDGEIRVVKYEMSISPQKIIKVIPHGFRTQENTTYRQPEDKALYDITKPSIRREFTSKFFINLYSMKLDTPTYALSNVGARVLSNDLIRYKSRAYFKITNQNIKLLRDIVRNYYAYKKNFMINHTTNRHYNIYGIPWMFYMFFYNEYSDVGALNYVLTYMRTHSDMLKPIIGNFKDIFQLTNEELIAAFLKHDKSIMITPSC